MSEPVPATIGRYTIERLLGSGGMGEVFLAIDTRLRRRVALKVLGPAAEGRDGDMIAAALREARAAAAVLHPNAAAIYDADDDEGRAYIVMEYVPGTPLRRLIGDETVSLSTRLRWLVDVAGALAAAHAVGVVHRDVKPENVMVREDGIVKVLDFGIAHDAARAELEEAPSATWREGFVGTPGYMAPEVVSGRSSDGRADQFAWGVLAYELLTGRLPWKQTASPLSILASVLTQDPLPIGPGIPGPVAEVVLRAISKAPEDRLPTLADAAAALTSFAAPAAPSFLPPPQSLVRVTDPAPARPRDEGRAPEAPPSAPARPPSSPPPSAPLSDSPLSLRSAALRVPPPPLETLPSGATCPPPPSVVSATTRPSWPPSATTSPMAGSVPRAAPSRPGSSGALRLGSFTPPPGSARRPPSLPPPSSVTPAPGSVRRASSPSWPGLPPVSPRPAPSSRTSRPQPRGLEGFHTVDLAATVDLGAHLAAVPAGATCKGMFFTDLLAAAARHRTPAEIARRAGIEDRRYYAFRDYPLAENLRLAVAVAEVVHPHLPLGAALRQLGTRALAAFLESHMGRTLFGVLEPDFGSFLAHGPRAYRLLFGFGEVTSERLGHDEYLIRARRLPLFLETFQVGVLESVLHHCRARGDVRVRPLGIADADYSVRTW